MSSKAHRAQELNHAISQLWHAAGIHSKDDFNQQVVPIYSKLLDELKIHQTDRAAEQQLVDLLNTTTKACHRRWSKRLPLKRPGSDYRKYEIIYTEALITAMAVNALNQYESASPVPLAEHLLPQDTLKRLQADPIVWEDWLGFFRQAEQGGLHAIATGSLQPPPGNSRPKSRTTTRSAKPPPPGSGRAMLEVIKTALHDGSLSYNQPGDFVQVDRAGRTFLEHPNILKWCREELNLNEDTKKLKSRFSRLKVLNRSNQGKQLFFGRASHQGHRRVGYIIENPRVLWSQSAPVGTFLIECQDV